MADPASHRFARDIYVCAYLHSITEVGYGVYQGHSSVTVHCCCLRDHNSDTKGRLEQILLSLDMQCKRATVWSCRLQYLLYLSWERRDPTGLVLLSLLGMICHRDSGLCGVRDLFRALKHDNGKLYMLEV